MLVDTLLILKEKELRLILLVDYLGIISLRVAWLAVWAAAVPLSCVGVCVCVLAGQLGWDTFAFCECM